MSGMGGFYQARSCAQLFYIYNHSQNDTLQADPDCASYFSGANVNKWVAVEANLGGDAAGAAAALGTNFGSAMWLALAIHAIGVEIYVRGPYFFPPRFSLHSSLVVSLPRSVDEEEGSSPQDMPPTVTMTDPAVESSAPTYTRRSRTPTQCLIPTAAGGWQEGPRPCWVDN